MRGPGLTTPRALGSLSVPTQELGPTILFIPRLRAAPQAAPYASSDQTASDIGTDN